MSMRPPSFVPTTTLTLSGTNAEQRPYRVFREEASGRARRQERDSTFQILQEPFEMEQARVSSGEIERQRIGEE